MIHMSLGCCGDYLCKYREKAYNCAWQVILTQVLAIKWWQGQDQVGLEKCLNSENRKEKSPHWPKMNYLDSVDGGRRGAALAAGDMTKF